jgi:hypothetical protein
MNLLGLLLSAMTSQASVGQVSGKTGLSEKQIKKLMMIAIPLLIRYMTQNASSNNGAQSLLGALMQHNKKDEMQLQLKDADEEDGGKIINHIFGKKKGEVTQNLSAQSGLTQEQVNQILAIMAPAILSGVSQATNDAAVSPQSAAPTISLGSTPGIFSALLGSAAASSKEEEQNEAINGTALLQALLNARR